MTEFLPKLPKYQNIIFGQYNIRISYKTASDTSCSDFWSIYFAHPKHQARASPRKVNKQFMRVRAVQVVIIEFISSSC